MSSHPTYSYMHMQMTMGKDEFKASTRMDETNIINSLVSSTNDIKNWMDTNHLKMNGAKMEFITSAAKKTTSKI